MQLLCAANKLDSLPDELSKMYSLKEVKQSTQNLFDLFALVASDSLICVYLSYAIHILSHSVPSISDNAVIVIIS